MENPNCEMTKACAPDSKNYFQMRYSESFRAWAQKKKYLKSQGYNLVLKWECEYLEERKTPRVKEFLEEYYRDGRPAERLAKRSGLKGDFASSSHLSKNVLKFCRFPGGRVESMKLFFSNQQHDDVSLHYTDINS